MNEETFDDLNRLPRRLRAVVFAQNAVPMSLNKQTSIVEELIVTVHVVFFYNKALRC